MALLALWLPSGPGQAQDSASPGHQLPSGHMTFFVFSFNRTRLLLGTVISTTCELPVYSLVFTINQQWFQFCLTCFSVVYSSSVLAMWADEQFSPVLPRQFLSASEILVHRWRVVYWDILHVVFHTLGVDMSSQFMNSMSETKDRKFNLYVLTILLITSLCNVNIFRVRRSSNKNTGLIKSP